MKTRILLADDMAILLDGLAAILTATGRYEVVGRASNGLDAVRLAGELQPDAVVMDMFMPGMDGSTAMRAIKAARPGARVVILSGHSAEPVVRRALEDGADAYVLKGSTGLDLVQALDQLQTGERFVSPQVAPYTRPQRKPSARAFPSSGQDAVLTRREMHVLKLVSEGVGNREIAQALCISVKTVEKHRASLKDKLGLQTTAELVAHALKHHLVGEGGD